MRTIIYTVINKESKQALYSDCRERKCVEYINTQENKENLAIVYKWRSI